jgi:peptidyl-prolyl cis-trans isomerase C
MTIPTSKHFTTPLALIVALVLTACVVPIGGGLDLIPATPTPTPSPTPTVTPIPLAVSVNGEGITVPEFESELARYQQAQAALGNTVSLEVATQTVMDNLIDTLLLAQGAAAKGYTVDDSAVQSRMDNLSAQLESAETLAAWESAHGYTEADFRSELRREIAAAWMHDQLATSIPTTAEQVHVKQILLYNADAAHQALGYLKAGWNFDDLAARYDPVTKGELGWFPRGYLPEPTIEEAAFALQPSQFSDILQTQAGYHILFVTERDPARPLSPDALLTLQKRVVQDWLTQRRNESTILFAP